MAKWCWTEENYYGGDRSGQNKSLKDLGTPRGM
jgi:hypothetical protein